MTARNDGPSAYEGYRTEMTVQALESNVQVINVSVWNLTADRGRFAEGRGCLFLYVPPTYLRRHRHSTGQMP